CDVADDERVRSSVEQNASSRRHEILDLAFHFLALRVAQRDQARLERFDFDPLLLASDLLLELFLERRQWGNANDIALANHAERLRPQHHVERLIPWHVTHTQGYAAADVVGRNDVDLSDILEQAQDVVNVSILEVEIDPSSGVAL